MSIIHRRVLVIDDDLDIQSFLLLTLKPYYHLKAVDNAAEALAEVASNAQAYDLILSDIHLPGMNGIQLVAELAARGASVPVIMMTATGTIEAAVDAMKNGVFDYILKPLNADDLKISI